jgi:hypothetical protein
MERKLINAYECFFGHQTITKDLDEGVTPFIIGCGHSGCGGEARSYMYPDWAQDMTPTYEWYRPSDPELKKLHQWDREHVRKGGLILRRIDTGKPHPDFKPQSQRDPNAPCLCGSGKKSRKCCLK